MQYNKADHHRKNTHFLSSDGVNADINILDRQIDKEAWIWILETQKLMYGNGENAIMRSKEALNSVYKLHVYIEMQWNTDDD